MTELATLSPIELVDLIIEALDELNEKVPTLKFTVPPLGYAGAPDSTVPTDLPVHHHLELCQLPMGWCGQCGEVKYEKLRSAVISKFLTKE